MGRQRLVWVGKLLSVCLKKKLLELCKNIAMTMIKIFIKKGLNYANNDDDQQMMIYRRA